MHIFLKETKVICVQLVLIWPIQIHLPPLGHFVNNNRNHDSILIQFQPFADFLDSYHNANSSLSVLAKLMYNPIALIEEKQKTSQLFQRPN